MTAIRRPASPWRSSVEGVGTLAPAGRFEQEPETDGVRKRCPRCREWRAFGQPCGRCEAGR